MVATRPVSIVGQDAAVVQELTSRYFYIKRLNWKTNTEAVYKKGVSILYFLRELRHFSMCSKVLENFCQFLVESRVELVMPTD